MTIAELRELVARATPGPWYWQRGGMTGCSYNVRGSKDYGEPCVMCSDGEHNARLITEALRALPALLDVAEAGRSGEIIKRGTPALDAAVRFVDEHIAPRKCDSDGVSHCWRCQSVYMAEVLRKLSAALAALEER